jgi:hypothetical protein
VAVLHHAMLIHPLVDAAARARRSARLSRDCGLNQE